ncbi:MAG: hypothetical protein M5U01_34920 [Ardenticatenaceae bacterium]|nr:hypothetical protein [Ardenticatenaceae bacterium]
MGTFASSLAFLLSNYLTGGSSIPDIHPGERWSLSGEYSDRNNERVCREERRHQMLPTVGAPQAVADAAVIDPARL